MNETVINEQTKIVKSLKHDITKLKTIANYAKMKNISPVWVYKLGKRGQVNIIEIDGVKFVKID